MGTRPGGLSEQDKGQIMRFLGEFTHDPVGFVYAAFPWGKDGTGLEGKQPQSWQVSVLRDIEHGLKTVNEVIRECVASGNGIGKSALVSWLILWAISTYEDTRGIVTANTDTQLKTKTWAELAKWHRLFIGTELFTYTATALFSSDSAHEKTWRIDAIPWSETNPEAFAGLHNQGRRLLIVFDEASAIADVIWETVEGATTDRDTEIMWCCFGNPTRPNGRFYECFNRYRKFWHRKQIDSRTVTISNKQQLNQWIDQYGIDHDFVKVHVLGEFPSAGLNQFISKKIADDAVQRMLETKGDKSYKDAPVIIGCDPAWTGEDSLEVVLRQGGYCKSLWSLPKNDNDVYVAEKLAFFEDEYNMSAGYIDQGYGTGIYSVLKSMGRGDTWHLVSFSGKPTDDQYMNKRAEMWGRAKQWLKEDGMLPNDQELVSDLTGPEAWINTRGKLQLEGKDDMKKRGLPSPNKGDALALTFAQEVRINKFQKYKKLRRMGKVPKYGQM